MFLWAQTTGRGMRGTGNNRPRQPRPRQAPLTSHPRRRASEGWAWGGRGERARGGARAPSSPHPPPGRSLPRPGRSTRLPPRDNYPPPSPPPSQATIPPSHPYPSSPHHPPHAAPAILRRAAFVPVGSAATRPRSARGLPPPRPVGGVCVGRGLLTRPPPATSLSPRASPSPACYLLPPNRPARSEKVAQRRSAALYSRVRVGLGPAPPRRRRMAARGPSRATCARVAGAAAEDPPCFPRPAAPR